MSTGDRKSCAPCVNIAQSVAKYGPAVGAASYGLLSVNVLNPSLNFGFISKGNATNILLAGSLLGTGAYIYNRPHLLTAANKDKLIYAGFGSVAFTFSSILLWAILRNLLPSNTALASLAGLGSGYVWATTAKGYLEFVDAKLSKK